ncbi:hypothetical protein FRC12_021783 [Ceratobasidium sp. 428]|nr:hypothetical protein FRC12_021783 [Ceratobasidium sp. 428]
MFSSSTNRPQISSDIYVHLSKACEEIQIPKSKGSEILVRAKICCFCERHVKLGSGSSDYSLQQHMSSIECKKSQESFMQSARSLDSLLYSESKPPYAKLSNDISERVSYSQLAADSMYPLSTTLPYSTTVWPDIQSAHERQWDCPGAYYDYGKVSMFSHYPWHLHDTDLLSYSLAFIDPKGRFVRVHSDKCCRKSSGPGAACNACDQVVLGRQFQEIIRRASPDSVVPPNLNIQFRTHAQLWDLAKEKTAQINAHQLKEMAAQRHIQTLSGRMDDQKRLVFAISQSDDAAVGRIVDSALRQGAGVDTIINRLVLAQQGLYHPHNYTQRLFDLVGLVLKIGGPRLAFAVAKAMHLPSISTVRGRLDLPALQPSVGFPTKGEITTNIESFFGHNTKRPSPRSRVGHSLLMDELAAQPRLRYSRKLDLIVGFGRHFDHLIDMKDLSTRPDALEVLLKLKALLDSGVIQRATEVTMAAITRFGQTEYNPAVILASGTCKTEKAPEQARLIQLILDSWQDSPHGAALNGDIWSICTDGDATRRRALFQLCMISKLAPESDLFRLLGHLPLLNLCCSPAQVTHDGDYKHEEKRLASVMRSRSGMLVNGAHITTKMLVKYLRYLGDLPESRILSFFDGKDPQNVPKANALLTNLHRASQLTEIASRPEHKPFVLLGEVIGSFVHPYTVPTLSLTEQITSLARCGHLLYALYRTDGVKFLPSQLFYDIQASIKNAVFCVAKTQLIDPSLPFYLLQTGTDRLEARFGTYRTATSDSNCDVLQMCERAASAQHIDEIFSAHPAWNRAPYRLSLDGKAGVDHTNPASWTGDVIVGHVDLNACWLLGRSQAANILTHANVPFNFNPTVPSTTDLEIDLMRPFGTYPGVQTDTIELDMQPTPFSELVDDDAALPNATDCDLPEEPQRLGDDKLSIEHLLPESMDDPSPDCTEKGWIFVKDKPVRLEIAVRCLLGSEGDAKSTDRLRRVCGFTRYLNPSTTAAESDLGQDFHVMDLVATFLRVKGQVALVIVRVTSITSKDGNSLESISNKYFAEPGISMSGQVLVLEFESGTWYWTQKYHSISTTAAIPCRKTGIGFDFCARLSCSINPELVERNGEQVWAFNHTQLSEVMSSLWATCARQNPEDHIPVCKQSDALPYQSSDGQLSLVHSGAADFIEHTARPEQAACFQCGEQVAIKREMRIHVGRHLLAMRSHDGKGVPNDQTDIPYCGFCGRNGTCITTVERQSRTAKLLKVVSDCLYRDAFAFTSTLKSTKTNPCTNHPVQCPRCPQDGKYIWSYGLQRHILAVHGHQILNAASEEIKKCEPSDEEFTLMRVDRETGEIQLPNGKRRRGVAATASRAAEPSSSKRKGA